LATGSDTLSTISALIPNDLSFSARIFATSDLLPTI
jgi:hypothetical protein